MIHSDTTDRVEAVPVDEVPFADLTSLTDDVARAVEEVWRQVTGTSSFIGGELLERFEEEWASYCGVRWAVGVANGTDSLELILRALHIGPGDEVILPANTFIATAEAVLLAGATPRFVDVDEDTLLMTAELAEGAINDRTAAIIPVHLYGNMADVEALGTLARRHGVALIEDAAQAHGSTLGGRKAGSFGVAGSFSFYPGKNLGAFGDGGAVVTDDAALAEAVRSMSNHGRTATSATTHQRVGRNSRLDALQAGILSAKLTRLDRWNRRRREIVEIYRELLRADAVRMVPWGAGSTHHLNVVRVPNRDWIQASLGSMGIRTGIHYPVPCHRQKPYRWFAPDRLPATERAASEILSLPLFPHMREEQVEHVCRSLNGLLERCEG